MKKAEAAQRIKRAHYAQEATLAAFGSAYRDYRDIVDKVGLTYLGLCIGDIIVCNKRRWKVYGATVFAVDHIVPFANILTKKGKVGTLELHGNDALFKGWTKE